MCYIRKINISTNVTILIQQEFQYRDANILHMHVNQMKYY